MNNWQAWELDILLDDYEEHGVAHVVARTAQRVDTSSHCPSLPSS